MFKLAKYLKPFIPGIVLSLVLLFAQALSDLNLPYLMSNIVNVGIQQGGIEHAAPEAISPEGLLLMTAYMTEDGRQLISTHYRLVSATDTNARGKTYRQLYPEMGDSVYILTATDPDTHSALDDAFGQAASSFIGAMRSVPNADSSGADSSSTDLSGMDLDISMLYRAHSLLPESTVNTQTTDDKNTSSSRQSGIMFAKAFCRELGMNTQTIQTNYIIKYGLYMLLIALLGGVAAIFVSLFSTRVASGAARNLRRDVFEKVESFSHNEFDQFSSSSLITRCTNDVTQVQNLVMMSIRMMCYAPIMGIGGVIMAIGKSASMSWVIALAVIVMLGLIVVVTSVAMPRFKIIQKLIDKLNLVSRENLSGLMVIRAFGTQTHENKRFDDVNKELTEVNLFVSRVMAFMMPMVGLIMNGVTLLIVWVGAGQIANASMQVGDMMAFMQYAMQIIMSFMMISMMFIMVPRAAVSGDRIAEVLETKLSLTDPVNPTAFRPAMKGVVEFKNVHFRYRDAEEDAISGISFTAQPGQTTAIIGATGSGKSTVANLLLRFYDVSQGSILVDGVDIRETSQTSLRAKIGYVPQKGMLLSGTIASNIRYGRKDASDAEVEQAINIAQAADFIQGKPEGLASEISQGGVNVSGGQKQRLSIARALAKKPEILVFDDSFSALDFKTDAQLRKALHEQAANCTMIVVAQRVGTIMGAEQILVLDEGRVVGCGTHNELLKSCPAYYEIASSQLAEKV